MEASIIPSREFAGAIELTGLLAIEFREPWTAAGVLAEQSRWMKTE
jgi:hypothetical protein